MPQPVARLLDMHTCPALAAVGVPASPILPPCAPTLLVFGRPAARMGDQAACVGGPEPIVLGNPMVLVNGMPLARMGDPTALGGTVTTGCFTVLA